MVKKFVALITTLLLTVPVVLVVASNITKNDYILFNYQLDNNDNDLYNSSRFTNVDDLSENPSDGIKLRLSNEVSPEDLNNKNYDDLIVEKNDHSLYFNEYLNIFKVKNETTGYVWSTGQDVIEQKNASTTTARYLSSTITLGYYHYNNEKKAYSKDIKPIYMTSAQAPKDSDYIKIGKGNDTKITVTSIADGKKLSIQYSKFGFSLNVYITLNDQGSLNIKIPDSEIQEKLNDYEHLIATIQVAPAIGSNVDGSEPGYMVIPDGSGSLIRYSQKTASSQYYLKYYGIDYGITPSKTTRDTKQLTMPIYGFVNGVKQDACLAIIEDGAVSCDLVVGLNGALGSKYNYLASSFLLRNQYLLYGINQTTRTERIGSDLNMQYQFIENEKATYVGIANTYQQYLLDNDYLEKTTNGAYRLRLDVLMSEAVKALIGTKNVTMTRLDDLNDIIDDLNSHDVNDLLFVLLGWNKSGLSGTTPHDLKYNSSVGSKREFKKFIKEQGDLNNLVYFYNDYVLGGEIGDYSKRNDIARSIQRLRISWNWDANVYDESNYLYPKSSYNLAKDNVKKYDKLDIESLALNNIGTSLFTTYYKEKVSHRNDSANYYKKLLTMFNEKDFNIALFQPFTYLWGYMNAYLDLPLYPNQYVFYTDTIPLVAYTLRGVVDYYAPYTNFFANQEEQLLRSLDYGALPSYIITSAESRKLKYTDSYQLFTTVYDHWSDTMISNYQILKDAYLAIADSTVIDRTVLSSGHIKLTYSNGTVIEIDYRNLRYKVEGGLAEWKTLTK